MMAKNVIVPVITESKSQIGRRVSLAQGMGWLGEIWKSKLWKRLILNVAIVCFTILGGFIFFYLEREEEKRYIKSKAETDREMLEKKSDQIKQFIFSLGPVMNTSNIEYVREALREFSEDSARNLKHTRRHINPYSWSFSSSVFYSMSIYTTVGFGNIVCDTLPGRIFTVFYALAGIPLLLVYSSEMGRWLQESITRFKCFIKRKLKKSRRASSLNIQCDRKEDIPLKETAILLLIYMFLGPVACMLLFEWDYFESFYFFFMTISTIGFGDIVPVSPKRALAASLALMAGLIIFASCVDSLVLVLGKKSEARKVAPKTSSLSILRDSVRSLSVIPEKEMRRSVSDTRLNVKYSFDAK